MEKISEWSVIYIYIYMCVCIYIYIVGIQTRVEGIAIYMYTSFGVFFLIINNGAINI